MHPSHTSEHGPVSPPFPARKRPPARLCVGCRQPRPKGQLLRLVCGPTGQLIVDLPGKLPGRGAYLCPRRACAERALQGTRLAHALRAAVSPCRLEALLHRMESALEEGSLAYIRIARKAGRVVSGYTQVLRALAEEPVALLLVAEDTAPQRRREYTLRCTRRHIPCRPFLTKARLGALMGREASTAIGIWDTHLAERLKVYLEGLSQLMER